MKLAEIAERLGCRLDGDANIEITGVAGIEEAQAGHLTFLSNPRYRPAMRTTRASAIIIAADAADVPLAALRSANPYLDFARAIELFYTPPRYAPGVHPTAVISPGATIGPDAHIGPFCFVDDGVVIGRSAVLHSSVSIYRGARIGDAFFAHSHAVVREFCQIGHRVILQNGVVVGCDGFGFAKQSDGRWYKMQQSGPVIIEDDVEVQAGTTIDRATVGATRIRRGAKLDNQVQIGHASEIGENTLVCAQTGTAGSSVVGNNCIFAGQVGLAGHQVIGDGVVLTARTAVHGDVPAGVTWSGSPGFDNKQWLKATAIFQRLPELQKTVRELKAEVERLREK